MKKYLKNKKFLGVVFFIILILVIFHYTGILRPVENIVVAVTQPVQTKVFQLSSGIRNSYDDWQNQKLVQEELEKLRTEANNNLIEKSRLKLLEEENDFLRKQLDFVDNNDARVLLSEVVGVDNLDSSKNIIINRGKKSGVELGMPVVVDEKFIIGKITTIHDYFSIVKLINDHNSELAVTIQNHDKTIGLISGEFGLGVKMELIPQTEDINPGDIIITSGLEEKIPRGLIIGTIENVVSREEDIFKEASVELPFNFDKIYQVSVIIYDPYVAPSN